MRAYVAGGLGGPYEIPRPREDGALTLQDVKLLRKIAQRFGEGGKKRSAVLALADRIEKNLWQER